MLQVLNLVATYVGRADDAKFVAAHFIPPLLEPVLGKHRSYGVCCRVATAFIAGDYQNSSPATRDAEVLTLMTEIISRLKADIQSETPRILTSVFECTLAMITANFEVRVPLTLCFLYRTVHVAGLSGTPEKLLFAAGGCEPRLFCYDFYDLAAASGSLIQVYFSV